jgi:DNA primase
MIVVESPLDAVKCGGVALCGVTVSDAQFDLMRKADKLIIAFDNPDIDPAGYKALEDFKVEAKKRGIEFWAFNYADRGALPESRLQTKFVSFFMKLTLCLTPLPENPDL